MVKGSRGARARARAARGQVRHDGDPLRRRLSPSPSLSRSLFVYLDHRLAIAASLRSRPRRSPQGGGAGGGRLAGRWACVRAGGGAARRRVAGGSATARRCLQVQGRRQGGQGGTQGGGGGGGMLCGGTGRAGRERERETHANLPPPRSLRGSSPALSASQRSNTHRRPGRASWRRARGAATAGWWRRARRHVSSLSLSLSFGRSERKRKKSSAFQARFADPPLATALAAAAAPGGVAVPAVRGLARSRCRLAWNGRGRLV